MYYCYLFEVKSIQQYLFQSNKLKDVISASERLDQLIDDKVNSTLHRVLEITELSSNLIDVNSNDNVDVYFLRCKGGAFYAYSLQRQSLFTLRSCWTLLLSQLFPTLMYADALSQGKCLTEGFEKGLVALKADCNVPFPHYPLISTLIERYAQNGRGVVINERCLTDTDRIMRADLAVDIDTTLHRQAYEQFNLRDHAALQERFTPPELVGNVSYLVNFDAEFPFYGDKTVLEKGQREAIKDMALLHIDGNGLGKVLRQLKEALAEQSDAVYCHAYRQFSEALTVATEQAAKMATLQLYQHVIGELTSDVAPSLLLLPMRPIVLGGDDITLFCRADLALQYAETFCMCFKQQSEVALKPLFDSYLPDTALPPYLTASGGVLFHKSNHPFMHSHQLVEALCKKAKQLTKRVCHDAPDQIGPAALAFYRISTATPYQLEHVIEQAQTHQIDDETQFVLGLSSYFVASLTAEEQAVISDGRHLGQLRQLISLCRKDNNRSDFQSASMPILMAKWRQIATLIAQQDMQEARRVFDRSLSLCSNDAAKVALRQALCALIPSDADKPHQWYWQEDNNTYVSFINDLLVVDHFQPVSGIGHHT